MRKSAQTKILYTAVVLPFLLLGVLLVGVWGFRLPSETVTTTAVSIVGEYSTDGVSWLPLEQDGTPVKSGAELVHIRGYFSQSIPENMLLTFVPNNLRATVRINGEAVLSFGAAGTFPAFSRTSGQAIRLYASPGLTTGDLVEMELENYYTELSPDGISKFLTRMTVGHGYEPYTALLSQRGFGTVIGLIIMMLGLEMLVIAVLFRDDNKAMRRRVLSFSFFALCGGFYVLSDTLYSYLPLLIHNPVLCNLLDVLPVLLIIPALCLYFTSNLEHFRLRKWMSAVSVVMLLACAAGLLTQLLGIADLYATQLPIGALGAAGTLFGLFCLAYDGLRGKNRNARFTLLTFLPVFLALLLEYLNYYWRFIPMRVAASMGVLLTVLLQLQQLLRLAALQRQEAEQKRRLETELTQSRIAVMLSQIQPHFLYNALSSIQCLCRDDPATAEKATENFSMFLRGNMDSLTMDKPIGFDKELEHTQHYLSLEQLRFPDKLHVAYDIETTLFRLPTLTLQPIVENAVRYGVTKTKAGGTVKISTRETDAAFVVTVEDNGAGFDPMQPHDDGRTHIGIENVRDRLARMSGGTLTIESTRGVGTIAVIAIPKGEKL